VPIGLPAAEGFSKRSGRRRVTGPRARGPLDVANRDLPPLQQAQYERVPVRDGSGAKTVMPCCSSRTAQQSRQVPAAEIELVENAAQFVRGHPLCVNHGLLPWRARAARGRLPHGCDGLGPLGSWRAFFLGEAGRRLLPARDECKPGSPIRWA
jgi:hypothetical protein